MSFPLAFWFLSLACLSYYGAIFPFVSLAQDFFVTKFSFTNQQANKIIGLIYLVSAPASPLLGLVIDKTGRNISWVFLSVGLDMEGAPSLAAVPAAGLATAALAVLAGLAASARALGSSPMAALRRCAKELVWGGAM